MIKKYASFLLFYGLLSSALYAQQQLENPGFETWDGSGATLEPVDWSSLKTSNNSFLAQSAPQVLFQDAGRTGNHSVRLENKSALGIVANGILTNGRVHADLNPDNGFVYTDASDPRWNTPFSSRPDSLVGWYKFQPASTGGNTDKGKAEIYLHKTGSGQNPVANTAANMIAHARFDMTTATAQWTRFSVPFNYSSSENPDYILVVLTSGDSTSAINGSIAWFDDLELIYNTASLTNGQMNSLQIAQKGASILLKNMQEGAQYAVMNALGQILVEGTGKSGDTKIPMTETGVYFVRVATSKGVVTKKIAFVKD